MTCCSPRRWPISHHGFLLMHMQLVSIKFHGYIRKPPHTYIHMYVNIHFSYIVSDFGNEFLVILPYHFRSHLEASIGVVHNVESEWTILKQELYTRWVTHTHSKNGTTHLEFNGCRSSQLSYNQILVYTCTFIFFLAATSLIP